MYAAEIWFHPQLYILVGCRSMSWCGYLSSYNVGTYYTYSTLSAHYKVTLQLYLEQAAAKHYI